MRAKPLIRILQAGDEAALEAFLLPRLDSSMFLLGNLRTAGLTDRGGRHEGTFAAAFEEGRIASVAAHYWNGNVILQAPALPERVTRAAVEASSRRVSGFIGPADQVGAATEALADCLRNRHVQMDQEEGLYALPLDRLIVPPALCGNPLHARRMERSDLDYVTRWRIEYSLETLGAEDGPAMRERCRADAETSCESGRTWVLEVDGRPVSTSSFNAALAEAVQVGPVWTPPEWRGRGYGRCVVAASLLDARADGVERAILFTDNRNTPARRAYAALGFERTGGYRLRLLHRPTD